MRSLAVSSAAAAVISHLLLQVGAARSPAELWILFYFFCREVHQAVGGEINETGSFSSCHWCLKEGGFRPVLLEEWEEGGPCTQPHLAGSLVWLMWWA